MKFTKYFFLLMLFISFQGFGQELVTEDSIGQESPTGQLRETWTVNSDNSYQQIQADNTYGTNGTKHSMKIECAFICTASGQLDLYFGHRLGFKPSLYAGSAVFVEEF